MSSKYNIIACTVLTFIALALTGCQGSSTQVASPGKTSAVVPSSGSAATNTVLAVTDTPVPTPTATLEPMALKVNGQGIAQAEYQAELSQLQAAHQALGQKAVPEEERKQVLDNLTDIELLAQGAKESGFKVDDAAVQAEIDRLSKQLGGAEALNKWITDRGYSENGFRASLARSLAAAWQRDQIAAKVPTEAEQIHARQILTTDESIAKKALERVQQPGMNFAAYAYQYDPLTGGDLGWFPRGYLIQPEVEDAAFQLQPGQISGVIKSTIGYHIVQVISREPSRTLSPDARRVLQHKALQEWLKARREGSQIEVLLP